MAPGTLTDTDLLRGAMFAIEQAGHLLHDAVRLYREKRYSSAAALAVLCREELGRAQILLELRERALSSGPVRVEEVRGRCDDHVEKLRRGRTATVIRWGPEDRHKFEGLLESPESEAYKKAQALVDEMVRAKRKREPGDVHAKRLRALYVEPNDNGSWNRPCDYSQEDCRQLMEDVANDYALHDQPWVKDEKLAAAIKECEGLPQMPDRIWP